MTDAGTELPGSTAVGRVALRVADLDRAVEFYRSVIGLGTRKREDDRAVLGADDDLLVLLGDPDAPERPPDAAGLFHAAFRVPTRGALGDALGRIESGWRLDGASDHRVSEALYLTDPEGNGVEVYRDRPRAEWPTAADGSVGMDTLPLDLDALRAAGDGRDRAPAATTVGHVHLEVSSLAAAESFYADAVGLRLRQRFGPDALFFAAGDYHHHVGVNAWNGRSEPARGRGLAWFEFVVPERSALAAARDRLEGGGRDTSRIDGGFAVADPDGIDLRFRGA